MDADSGRGLERGHFTRIAEHGFGDPLNAYPHSMAWFGGSLYVGTMRANLCLLKGRTPIATRHWPVPCPEDPYDLDLRAQIWRYRPDLAAWQLAHQSPLQTSEQTGEQVPRELSYRGMAVLQAGNDADPALYVATWSPSKAAGPLILRSGDGEEFVPVSRPGLGRRSLSAFRALEGFDGRLFVAPSAAAGQANLSGSALVMVSADPARGRWRLANTPGFGNPDNLTVFELATFDGHLYAGTLNPVSGYELWKTRAQGRPPYQWTLVLDRGADRGPLNEAAVSMFVFRDALYVGSGIQNGGYDRTHDVGPAAAELIRVHPDDSWELLVGEARFTSGGARRPLSDFGPGFNNLFNGYFWRMAELDGSLYLGTFDWSSLLPFLALDQQGGPTEQLVRWLGTDNVHAFEAGFDLFRSTDGTTWVPVCTSGFGNPYNYGVRTMLGTPCGLFVGAANPFGPEVAVPADGAVSYRPNPLGGAEVWLGTRGPR